MKKILCLILVLMLCSAMAFAEGDLQAQLDAANARIAELESAVELYKPFYDAQVVVEYDGGVIFRDDVLAEYAYYESMYAQYGISLADYGMDGQFKQQAAETLMQAAAMEIKAAELGLNQLDDATLAALTEEATANFETYITSIQSYFTSETATEEEVRAQAVDYLASMGYSVDGILASMITAYVDEQLYNHVTADVAITEEEIQANYDELVAGQQDSFATDYNYINARNNGDTIVYHPEGFRAVKQVLIKFDDAQTTTYSDLTSTKASLEAELAAIETAEEPRTADEINADIAAVDAEIEALYAQLMPTAQEVVDKFNDGTPFADLIAAYNEDPGMMSGVTAEQGYAVAATSTDTWDSAFVEGAMSIEAAGQISAPIRGSYGFYIIHYESDIPAGIVALDDVRADIEAVTLDTKLAETYSAAITEWTAALNPIYHLNHAG